MRQGSQAWRWLFARLGTLGWGALLAGGLLTILEWTGTWTHWVHKILSARLAPLGGELRLGAADFRWLEPGLVLEDLSLATEKEILSAEYLHVRFGWQGGLSLVPTKVHLRGARIVLDPALANGIRGLLNLKDGDAAKFRTSGALSALPDVLVEDLTLLVETSTGEQVEVLHVVLLLESISGSPRVVGQVQTPRQRSEGASGSIRLSGGVSADGVLELLGQAVGLEITPADIPKVPEFESIREWKLRGNLDLEARIVGDLHQEAAPRAEFTGRLENASLLPPGAKRAVEELELLYTLNFEPEGSGWLWDTRSWSGVANARGTFAGETFEAGALLGDSARNDSHFEAWLKLDAVDIAAPIDELFSEARWFDDLHQAATPSGVFSARVSTRLPRQADGKDGPPLGPEVLAHIVVEPGTTLAYHGWPPRRSDGERVGFAMPASVVRGEITHAYTQRVARRGLTRILLDLEHASGPAKVRYLEWSAPVDRPPFASSSEVHLEIEVPRLDVDEELERAIAGLDPILGEGKIWSQYAPTGGSLGIHLYLAHLPGSSTTGIRLNLDVREVGCTLATFPVPVQSATGRIEVVSTLDGETGSSWRLDGTAGSATFRVQGRERSRWSEEGEREPILSTLAVRARGIDVNGPVLDVLGESTRDSVAGLVLEGKVDADLATYASGSLRRGLELRPVRGMSSTPVGFPGRVDDLHGTLRLAWNDAEPSEGPDTRGWVPGLEGSGPTGEHVLFTGSGTREGWGGSVFGTGISASMWSADEALSGTASAESDLSIRGVVDIEATISQSPLSGEQRDPSAEDELADETWTTRLTVVLRSNTLSDGGRPLLEELEGRFTMADGIITASEIKGRLGETEVFFEDLHLKNDATALTLSTKIHATGIPLDAEHLHTLLDEELLTSLVEDLGLRGTIDVNQGTLQVIAPREGNRTVRFSGQLTISDMALEAGLPVVVQSAQASVRDLIVEDGELRAWGRIENLYGNCFDSELGPASALVPYVGGVLVIEDFPGSFERGPIRPPAGDSDARTAIRGGPARRRGPVAPVSRPDLLDLPAALPDRPLHDRVLPR